MLSKSQKSVLRKVVTVITSPVWVPVAVAGGLIVSPVKALADSVEDAERTSNAAKGVGMFPINLVGNALTLPLRAVGAVGETMFEERD